MERKKPPCPAAEKSAIVLSALAARGTSGAAGGSLPLIPTACSLFGIPAGTAAQAVGIGFIISMIRDPMETALGSCGDPLSGAAAEYRYRRKNGRTPACFPGAAGEPIADRYRRKGHERV